MPTQGLYGESFRGPRGLARALTALLAVASVVAIAALVLEYGFRRPIVATWILHAAEAAVVGYFMLYHVIRLGLAHQRRTYLKHNAPDLVLIAIALLAAGLIWHFRGRVMGLGALYVAVTQVYLLVALLLRGVNLNLQMTGSGLPPSWLLLGSFAFLCLAGSGLLMLPAATAEHAAQPYYLDALFTSTSATCVTGLITRNTGTEWSFFGQAVILVLIQLGGLGIMLFGTVLALLVGRDLSVRQSETVGEMLGQRRRSALPQLAKFVVLSTLAFEAVGAALSFGMFLEVPNAYGQPMGPAEAAWYSVFHAISAFCNAGFCLYDRNLMAGVGEGPAWATALREHWQVMGVMAPLIVLGGVGFPALMDAGAYLKGLLARWLHRPASFRAGRAAQRPARPRVGLHTRVVLAATLLLLVVGAAGLLLIETVGHPDTGPGIGRVPIGGGGAAGDWASMPLGERAWRSVFQSVTARTAGFNTIDMDELSPAGKLWMCGLMTIGGSPGGTAGGMKTVVVVLLAGSAWSVLARRGEVELGRRSIPSDIVRRATAIAFLYMCLLVLTTLLLAISMPDQAFIDVLFEASSACGTVGLSTGITGAGHAAMTRLVTIAAMFLGRLGPITLLLAMTTRLGRARYAYARENVLIG